MAVARETNRVARIGKVVNPAPIRYKKTCYVKDIKAEFLPKFLECEESASLARSSTMYQKTEARYTRTKLRRALAPSPAEKARRARVLLVAGEMMKRRIARTVAEISGGERADHMTARMPPGMARLDSGTPNFPTPEHVRKAAKEALNAGLTGYAPGQGDPEFLEAVCEHVEREAEARYTPRSIITTNGASSGIYAVMTTFLNPGDEVVLMDPTFSLYAHVARQLGAVPVQAPHAGDYHLDLEAVRRAISPRARLLLINNPNNPTGVVYRHDELEALLELAAAHDLMVVSDEAYAKILQPGFEHVPLLSFTAHAERLILLDTFSKTYSMTGWRLGFMVVPEDLARTMFGVHRSINGPINTFVQRAGAAALRGSQECVAEMARVYHRRGRLIHEMAREISGLTPVPPQGGFYQYCRYAYPLPSAEMRKRIWEAGAAVRSGSEFGDSGEGHLRFTYSVDEEVIAKGMEVVGDVFRRLG